MVRVLRRAALYFTPAAVVVLAGMQGACRGDIAIAGDRLTVRSAHIRVVLRAGEVAEITNRLTDEVVSTGTGRLDPMTTALRVKGAAGPMRADGWRLAHEDAVRREAAQTVLRDGSTTVWLNVQVDPETQDIVIGAWGDSLQEGLQGFRLGVRSLDLTVGRLVVPTQRGLEYSRASGEPPEPIQYPGEWAAQMLVWQSAQGGVVFYSRDDESRYKRLHLARRGDRLDLGLETQAEAPWSRQTSVPHLEWRINAYRGDWRVPTAGYRALMSFLKPRAAPSDAQLWVGQIEAVVSVGADDAAKLGDIARQRPPAKSLLLLNDWREGDDPARRMTERAGSLISRAHSMGFYVMVPVRITRASKQWDGLGRVARYQARDPVTGDRKLEDGGVVMNPASREWRAAVVRGLRSAFAGDCPDAMLILDGCSMLNDGAGRVDGRTAAEGLAAMMQDIQRAFPDMVLASDGLSELIWPHVRIARRPIAPEAHSRTLAAAIFGSTILWFGP
ncbi:MAG: hypothetical protein GX446_18845 [Chthonomonadales bacterium]|nr:hypothetical protein [Chthonomonadales bacterium]